MAKAKVLITVKTYPTISEKYKELACTAGFREDEKCTSNPLETVFGW